MENTKYYTGLSDSAWVALILATMLMYGGLHPSPETKSTVFDYCGLLMIFLNLPLSIHLIYWWGTERYFDFTLSLFLILKLGLGFWLFNT